MNPMVILFVALALLAFALLRWSNRLREQSGLPQGDVIYTDQETWKAVAQPLVDDDLQLIGKPDYLVQTAEGEIIPVELKSSI